MADLVFVRHKSSLSILGHRDVPNVVQDGHLTTMWISNRLPDKHTKYTDFSISLSAML
jgi:hypothetical protein